MLPHAPFLSEVCAGWAFVLTVAVVKHYNQRKTCSNILFEAALGACISLSYLDGHTRVFSCTGSCTPAAWCHRELGGITQRRRSDTSARQNLATRGSRKKLRAKHNTTKEVM